MSQPNLAASSLSPEAKRTLLAQLLRQKANAPKQCLASFAQERLWFLNQLAPDQPLYTVPVLLWLSGPLEVVALEQSVNEIVRRHEALRTTFVIEAGRLNQVIAPELMIPLSRTDLRALPIEQRAAEAERLAQAEARQPFDLAAGPLLRVHLWVLDVEEHLLLLNLDHRVSDEWSFGVFFRELSALYPAWVPGQPSPLTELPIQYADYSIWQRQWLQSEEAERQKAYWREQLSGAPLQLELPTDRPRPAVQTYGGAAYPFSLSPALSQTLQAFSRQAGVTLFMTLLTAFQVLLFRYTGQVDLCVGIPVANRTQTELENLIGLFLNTVVIRASLAGHPTFREMVKRVQKLCVDSYLHQDLPFDQVVKELQLERRLSQSPLFQVMFVLQNDSEETLHLPQVVVQKQGINPGVAKFDLILSLVETGQGLRGWWEYNTDIFDSTTLVRWTEHFRVLLESVLADPDQPLATLPLLAPPERRQLLEEWNATEREYPREKCIPELFASLVNQTPEAVALACKTDQLTYAALNERANQLADYLRGQGVGPEVLVGLCLERSLEMVVGVLGVLKAGGAYVPLDPAYPLERLAFMLNDSKVQFLLTQAQLLDRLPEHSARIVCLDTDWPEIAHAAREKAGLASLANLPGFMEISPENLAYVIYTSGSTGQPKGVAVTHRGIGNLAVAQIEAFQVSSESRVLQFASFSFDACVSEIAMALLAGATLCLAPAELLFPGTPLLEVLRDQAITVATLPPSVLTALAPPPLPALQTLAAAGEACPAEVVTHWGTGRRLLNAYGPTEITVCATMEVCQPDGTGRAPAIGRPIANTQVYVLDARLQPTPIGIPGEVYLGGVGLARGYHGRPELTAERFVPNPFAKTQKKGQGPRTKDQDSWPLSLYRTGDWARWRAEGTLEYLGRVDQQVKLRGYRIELGEIEVVLRQHPGVREAIVVLRETPSKGKQLVAYWVGVAGQAPSLGELRTHVRAWVPEYMLPAAWVQLPALPLSPNGKVDRQALPEPSAESVESGVSRGLQTEMERRVGQIWAEVLQTEPVGAEANFFDLGGHSLLLIEVHNRLQAMLEQELRIVDLFKYPTVATLAAYLEHGAVEAPVSTEKAKTRVAAMARQRQMRRSLRSSVEEEK